MNVEPAVRASVIWWSALSGAVLGLFADAILIGVALSFSAIVVPAGGREHPRWAVAIGAVALAGVFVGMTVLGYLEGRLKAV